MSSSVSARLEIPFLGLHYFDEEHEQLFFGRDEQLRDLLAKLADSRFVTVIGSSGTGKSSLARAGLVPALRAGFFTAAGARWRIVKTRPGSSPIRNLAEEIESVFSSTGAELTLRRGPLGLMEAAQQSGLRDDENLLIMVDQFEEIFRYQREAVDRQAAAEEAASFVKLLLEATARVDRAIFVLVTMRSDYLGACAQFRDLPERINTGLYLIPRMRRDQLEEAITGPAAIAGASFSPPLVQKLLNDAGEDPDQLPVLQHALLRAWLNWKKDNNPSQRIDFRHYEATGGVRHGLDNHAEEIYGSLDAQGQKIAQVLFRCLTERDPSNNDIRRPTQLGVIAGIAGVSADEVRQVADAFRGEGVSFLTPTCPAELQDDTVIDITHESLIRKWYRLRGTAEQKGWVQHEAESREQYHDLVKRARRAQENRGVLTGADLNDAVAWRAQELRPEWGLRYDPAPDAFALVQDYIARSVKARKDRRLRTRLYVALVAIVIIAGLGFLYREIENAKDARAAEVIRAEAEEQLKAEAAYAKSEATRADGAATDAKTEAKRADDEAEHAGEEAVKAKDFQRLATARQLASQAEGLKDQDRDSLELRALLALESLKLKPLPEATAALRKPIELLSRPLWVKEIKEARSSEQQQHSGGPSSPDSYPLLQFSPDGKYLARMGAKLHVYNAMDGEEIKIPSLETLSDKDQDSLAWSDNQLYLLVADFKQTPTELMVYAISLPEGTLRQVSPQKQCTGLCLLTSDAKYLMVTSPVRTSGQLFPLDGGEPISLTEGTTIVGLGAQGEVLREVRDQNATAQKATGPVVALFDPNNNFLGNLEDDPERRVFDLGGNSGYLAVLGRDKEVQIFKRQPKLERLAQFVWPVNPTALALSPDGRLIAIGDEGGGVRVLDWALQAQWGTWRHSNPPVLAIAFSPNGRLIASMDISGQLRVFPAPTHTVGDQGPVISSASHHKLALGVEGSTGAYLSAFLSASFVASGRFLRVGPGYFRIFDTQLNKWVSPVSGSGSWVTLSPDGRYGVFADQKGKMIVDLIKGVSVKMPDANLIGSTAAVGPGVRFLAQTLPGDGLRIFDISKGTFFDVSKQTFGGSPQPLDGTSPVFSPDGRWLLVTQTTYDRSGAGNATVFLLPCCDDWTQVRKWSFAGRLSALFSPNGRFLFLTSFISGFRSAQVTSSYLIDTASGQKKTPELPQGVRVTAFQFSADDHLLAIATSENHGIRLFDSQSGKLLKQIEADLAVTALMFSHSSRYLAAASVTAAPRVFDVRSGDEVDRMVLEQNENFLAFQFSPDDHMLVVASRVSGDLTERTTARAQELMIKREYLSAEDLIREGCGSVSRNLTDKEWNSYLSGYPYEKTCPLPPVSPQTPNIH